MEHNWWLSHKNDSPIRLWGVSSRLRRWLFSDHRMGSLMTVMSVRSVGPWDWTSEQTVPPIESHFCHHLRSSGLYFPAYQQPSYWIFSFSFLFHISNEITLHAHIIATILTHTSTYHSESMKNWLIQKLKDWNWWWFIFVHLYSF